MARPRPSVVSVRPARSGKSLDVDRRTVGVVGTLVVVNPEGPGWGASARLPDGSLLEPIARTPVRDGLELTFDRALPPGTRIVTGGETILRVESSVLAV